MEFERLQFERAVSFLQAFQKIQYYLSFPILRNCDMM